MKQILTLFLFFASLGAIAKKHDEKAANQAMQPITQQILQWQPDQKAQAKPTQLKHRIVAWGYRRLDGGDYRDSSHYFYSSNTRGTVFDNCMDNNDASWLHTKSRPDSFYYYTWDPGGSRLSLREKYTYTYDAADNIVTKSSSPPDFPYHTYGKAVDHYNPDGTINQTDYYDSADDTVVTYSRYFFYNSQNKTIRDSSFSFINHSPGSKSEYTYNVQSDIDSIYYYYWDPAISSWRFSGLLHRTYDTQSNLDSIYQYTWDPTTSSWRPEYITNYDVDANGNTVLYAQVSYWGSSPEYYQTQSDYNAFNMQIRSISYVSSDGINYTPSYKDSTAYNGNNPVYTHRSSYSWNGSNWDITYLREYDLNAAGNWDTGYWYGIDANHNPYIEEKGYFIYNSYGWLVNQYGLMYDTATHTYATTPYDVHTYYYEDYDDPTTVAEPSATKETVTIYPNPATEQLTITTTQAQPLPLTLTDLSGRTVRSTTLHTRTVLDISTLPPGLYLLKAGSEVYKVVKQ